MSLDVAPVWSGHPVGFALLTAPPNQYVAFYDADRRMTVAGRRLDSSDWRMHHLPQTLGWDSHNYVTMALDRSGRLHLCGNMHVNPLVYFRTSVPGDIVTFEQVPSMTGEKEDACTYPHFLRDAGGNLVFTYRHGRSGNGVRIYNRYDLEARAWRRLLDQPLLSGQGKMNAYPVGPARGPDGFFHLLWVWRDTPDCATNHDVCYARSRDLVHWETSSGKPLGLPITIENAEVVDPVPPGGGVINGNTRLGFDSLGRSIVSYHKYDEAGATQIYNARLESTGWRICQTSRWEYRWDFQGGGAIPFEISVGPVRLLPDGSLVQSYRHPKHGSRTWRLDEATLEPTGHTVLPASRPPDLARPESPFEGMQVRWCGDSGSSGEPGVRYELRWETLGPNRDRPREGPLPGPSMLRLYTFRTEAP